ncbi:FHA domain-containing protein [Streptomyces sp. LP05-1]|uniref:FHA domain-containing protein n=1 Tax=Streptomyces pyxinae TaxID=2970734 RepID=A0ABT2CP20_9ACTN|nr:FHA domain-containing protein [Streptomyces sp. LP05-1]MCS0639174.1 FHA domain-containing protein [Streptomyces sp. LP05-1]
MQIRLTVLAPPPAGQSAGRVRDVLVTAPSGTALAAVASQLAAAVAGPDTTGTPVFHAGRERLDAQRRTLGEPPLTDGAVLSLQVPGEEGAPVPGAGPRLHVVAGPDAGGVHLLHAGRVRVGRAADADVPLDDPDVSRTHCVVTVGDDGRVTVEDPGSTNGTTLDGTEVGARPVRLAPGALLRLGESALRLASGPPAPDVAPLPVAPDGEGRLRVRPRSAPVPADPGAGAEPDASAGGARAVPVVPASRPVPGPGAVTAGRDAGTPAAPGRADGASGPAAGRRPSGSTPPRGIRLPDGTDAPGEHAEYAGEFPGRGEHREHEGRAETRAPAPCGLPHGADQRYSTDQRYGADERYGTDHRPYAPAPEPYPAGEPRRAGTDDRAGTQGRASAQGRAGTDDPAGADDRGGTRRRRGIGAWARRLTGGGGRPDDGEAAPGAVPAGAEAAPRGGGAAPSGGPAGESWPDPAAVLLTALGPGARLWERGPEHPEALVVRLGTADRAELPAVPVTVGLREAGSLGLAGPRARLAGLARSVLAQLAALHSPADLELVLISADRARPLADRRREWAWLGWLPQLRPAHGQDCRLLLAYDREQAEARTAELTRRLDESPLGTGWASADHRAVAEAAARFEGPYTVVVVDGDPGSAALRETTARLAGAGAAAGIHLVCLAETPAASPLSPVAATYETACAALLPFRECGAVALLSGDVATALRLLRTAGGRPAGHGTVAGVDAVSAAWAERFARALAPLRAEGAVPRGRAAATALPRTARLLDELELARATPASLMARWAAAPEATAVLGAGARGPVTAELAGEGPHLLIEGPPGSGRTELLRSVAASLAAGARPDRLGLLLVDGSGAERGEGLAPCTELPHATEHLVASDPVRMRMFAQALGAELKRRAELLGPAGFPGGSGSPGGSGGPAGFPGAGAAAAAGAPGSSRTTGVTAATGAPGATGPSVPSRTGAPGATGSPAAARAAGAPAVPPQAQRGAPVRGQVAGGQGPAAPGRLPEPHRPAAGAPELPRLVVLVDDYDALVAPALGSPGRPAAGSVVRALEAVAREGGRLGVHLVATSAGPGRAPGTEPARAARLRVELDAPPAAPGPDDPAPGRGRLLHPDGRVTPFQGGRVTGRIPRTATLRPTVVPLEWERMGDPPARRPVRELGNGPTDLALLASALERAARSVEASPPPRLSPAHP